MLVKSVSDNAAARAWESRNRDWNVIMRMKIVRGMCQLKSWDEITWGIVEYLPKKTSKNALWESQTG